jgi:hypothetical protein
MLHKPSPFGVAIGHRIQRPPATTLARPEERYVTFGYEPNPKSSTHSPRGPNGQERQANSEQEKPDRNDDCPQLTLRANKKPIGRDQRHETKHDGEEPYGRAQHSTDHIDVPNSPRRIGLLLYGAADETRECRPTAPITCHLVDLCTEVRF